MSYTIFVDTFTESRPGQVFKGKGEAQVSFRLLVGKSAVWKAACAKIKNPSTRNGPLVWSEKTTLPSEFVAGSNRLEVALIKSGMVYVKDTVDIELTSHQYPKSFNVPMSKLKGELNFTIEGGGGGGGGASPTPARASASAADGGGGGGGAGGGMSLGEQRALERREREVTRKERELADKERELKDLQAAVNQSSSFVAPEWKKISARFNREMMTLHGALETALKKCDFSAAHEAINDMAEKYEDQSDSGGASAVVGGRANSGATLNIPPPIATDTSSRSSPRARTKIDVEQDLAFAVGSGDFKRAIELREELRKFGGDVPTNSGASFDANKDPFASDGPGRSAPPPRGGLPPPIASSPSSGPGRYTPPSAGNSSGVSQLISGSDAEIDAEIEKLTKALSSVKALAEKWRSLGNNGARTAAEQQAEQLQREIDALAAKKGGGAPDMYQALPNDALAASRGAVQLPPPAGRGPGGLPPPMGRSQSARGPPRRGGGGPGRRGGRGAPPPRPSARPPPRPALASRMPPSRLPKFGGPPPPLGVSVDDTAQRSSADTGRANLTAEERTNRRRSQSLGSMMAKASKAVPEISTVEMSKTYKDERAAEPVVDALVSQGQRDAERSNASKPSAQLAEQYNFDADNASATVMSAEKKGSGRNAFTSYKIEVVRDSQRWTVYRRYGQFDDMVSKLKRSAPSGVPQDPMPPKEGSKFDAGIIELRRSKFNDLLQALHRHPSTLASEDLRVFLAPLQLGDTKPQQR